MFHSPDLQHALHTIIPDLQHALHTIIKWRHLELKVICFISWSWTYTLDETTHASKYTRYANYKNNCSLIYNEHTVRILISNHSNAHRKADIVTFSECCEKLLVNVGTSDETMLHNFLRDSNIEENMNVSHKLILVYKLIIYWQYWLYCLVHPPEEAGRFFNF